MAAHHIATGIHRHQALLRNGLGLRLARYRPLTADRRGDRAWVPAAALIVEVIFGILGLVPAERSARVVEASIT